MTTKTLRSIAELQDAGLVPDGQAAALEQVAARYAVAITPAMADLIDRDDPDDPIARQFVPDPAELVSESPERADPIGDDAFSPVEGIVHRYPDRVLLKLVYTCPVYCPFCFRAKSLLKSKGIAFSEIDVTGDDAMREKMIELSGGRRTVPEIFINGKIVGGYDELSALDTRGELDAMLAEPA